MRNLEIKVRHADLDRVLRLALVLGARDAGMLRQVDAYFQVPRGRLKLRRSPRDTPGTLIHYVRPDLAESRYSEYRLVEVGDAQEMEALLDASLGTLVIVTKTRRLLLHGATRIHLDRVEGLGGFVELETVVREQTLEEARAEHALVKEALDLYRQETVTRSYGDLLLEARG